MSALATYELSCPLSERERDVLRLIGEGRASKEIARALYISPRTVEMYRLCILRKLRARNAAEAVRLASAAWGWLWER